MLGFLPHGVAIGSFLPTCFKCASEQDVLIEFVVESERSAPGFTFSCVCITRVRIGKQKISLRGSLAALLCRATEPATVATPAPRPPSPPPHELARLHRDARAPSTDRRRPCRRRQQRPRLQPKRQPGHQTAAQGPSIDPAGGRAAQNPSVLAVQNQAQPKGVCPQPTCSSHRHRCVLLVLLECNESERIADNTG